VRLRLQPSIPHRRAEQQPPPLPLPLPLPQPQPQPQPAASKVSAASLARAAADFASAIRPSLQRRRASSDESSAKAAEQSPIASHSPLAAETDEEPRSHRSASRSAHPNIVGPAASHAHTRGRASGPPEDSAARDGGGGGADRSERVGTSAVDGFSGTRAERAEPAEEAVLRGEGSGLSLAVDDQPLRLNPSVCRPSFRPSSPKAKRWPQCGTAASVLQPSARALAASQSAERVELDELANELLREEGTLVPASPTVKADKADAKPLKVGFGLRTQRNGYTMFSTCNGICAAHDAKAEMRRDWR
jgi:hypothetical protein